MLSWSQSFSFENNMQVFLVFLLGLNHAMPSYVDSKQYMPYGQIPQWGRMESKQYMPYGQIPQWGRIEKSQEVVPRAEASDCVVLQDKYDESRDEPLMRPRQDVKCGVNHLDRIVGGQEATAHSFPWSVSLKVSWGTHFCGGSIINEKVIIS